MYHVRLLLASLIFASFAQANVVRVDVDADAGSPDGHTWVTAYSTIQAGIAAAEGLGGGEVWVAEGTYTGSAGNPVNAEGDAVGDTTIILVEGVHLYGGFDGTEADRALRSPASHPTIIDGENLRRGVFSSGIPVNGATLDGFTIKRGRADTGAGMYNEQSALTVAQCVIEDNHANMLGGGIFSLGSPATTAPGVLDKQTMTGVEFRGNTAALAGGGLYTDSDWLVLQLCKFVENSAALGGGVYDAGGQTEVIRSVLKGNAATDAGGAYAYEGLQVTEFTNSLLTGNSATNVGGAIYHDGHRVSLTYCTVADNSAGQGGAFYGEATFPLLLNSIVTDNGASNIVDSTETPFNMLASCVEQAVPDVSQQIIDEDPRFVSSSIGLYGLLEPSPCRDTAIEGWAKQIDSYFLQVIPVWGELTEDINGNERPQGPGFDMGAYEVHDQFVDSDDDGLADDWERTHFGNLERDGTGDFDLDGLTDVEEYRLGTNPKLVDTDDDGYSDKEEADAGSDPLNPDDFPGLVVFPDPNLDAAVRSAIGIASGPILESDLVGTGFTALYASQKGIASLAGLEYCTDLELVYLNSNAITDVTPLTALPDLETIYLSSNDISDLTAFAGLQAVSRLFLESNEISDVAPLANLTGLTELVLNYNAIPDVAPLTNLPNLAGLMLIRNGLTDFALLSTMPSLRELSVRENDISSLAPLANMPDLEEFSASYNSIAEIPAGLSLPNLRVLDLGGNTITDCAPVAAFTALTNLSLWNNQISDISPVSGLTGLTRLSVQSNQLTDLSPVSGLVNLTYLNAGVNQISDLTPLADLTELTALSLSDNLISDIAPLGSLTKLTSLHLSENGVSDVAPLAQMPLLHTAHFDNNTIADIAPLTNLVELNWVGLNANRVMDITPLAGLSKLRNVSLRYNLVRDILPLVDNAGVGAGDQVDLFGTPLTQVSLCTYVPALQARGATVTFTGACGADQDGDDLSDAYESRIGTNPNVADTDGDGLDDGVEIGLRTDPLEEDSDGDGVSDGDEVDRGTDPLDENDTPIVVDFPDPNLEAAIREAIGLPSGPIYADYLDRLYTLWAGNRGISDLTGLEYCTYLFNLGLESNAIEDISPLASLSWLSFVSLSENAISDVSPLAGLANLDTLLITNNDIVDVGPLGGLTELTSLDLTANQIADISALSSLTNLTSLYLSANDISDLGPVAPLVHLDLFHAANNSITSVAALANLTNLFDLFLHGNEISDVAPLSTLTRLVYLWVSTNQITDLSPLAGLTNIETLAVHNNPLTDIAAIEGLVNLRTLYAYSCGIQTIPNVSGLSPWVFLGLDRNEIRDVAPLTDLPVRATVNLEGNPIVELTPLVLDEGFGEDISLRLRRTPLSQAALCDDIPTLQDRGAFVTFTGSCGSDSDGDGLAAAYETEIGTDPDLADTDGDGYDDGREVTGGSDPLDPDSIPLVVVEFPDPALDAAVRVAIALPVGDIYNVDLIGIGFTSLTANGVGISDLSGLEYCTDLQILNVNGNEIEDVGPLSGLKSLVALHLNDNFVSDLTPLSALESLTFLSLYGNMVEDLSPLASMAVLWHLNVSWNQVSDISVLSELDALISLSLHDNLITDLSPIAALYDLEFLRVGGNAISSLEPLAALRELNYLSAGRNAIIDLTPVSNLTKLEHLYVGFNQLSDISAVAGLTALFRLDVQSNSITDITPVQNLTGLFTFNAYDNQIFDLSALSGLVELDSLRLYQNAVSDISALSGLTNLRVLSLAWNPVFDVTPLIDNSGIGADDSITMLYTPLTQAALCEDVPELLSRGATVIFTGACGDDADGDNLSGDYEWYLGSNPNLADTDGDGLGDGDEVYLGTDPLDPDTDGDGIPDGTEVDAGTEPLDEADFISDVYVDIASGDDVAGTGTQANPWATVAHAVAIVEGSAGNVISIHVAEGVYTELNAGGGPLLLDSYEHLLGGYEAVGWSRDAIVHVSILDASEANSGNPSNKVVVLDGVIEVQLDGFTITGAYSASSDNPSGSAVFGSNLDSTTVISSCLVVGNYSAGSSGGLFLDDASPTIKGCSIAENYSATVGGGVTATGSSFPTIDGCHISGNGAYLGGGGMYIGSGANPTIANSTISNNSTPTATGGGLLFDGGSGVVTNCTIANNIAEVDGGGGVATSYGAPKFVNCIFASNENFAIARFDLNPNFVLEHCLFEANTSGDFYEYNSGSPTTYTGALAINNNVPGATANVDGDPQFAMPQAGTWTSLTVLYPTSLRTRLGDANAAFEPGALRGSMISLENYPSPALILDNTATTIDIDLGYAIFTEVGDAYQIFYYDLGTGSAAIDLGRDTSDPADGGVIEDIGGTPRGIDGDGLGAVTADGSDYDIGAYEYEPEIVDAITVTSPNGGETLYLGGTWDITWDSTGNVGSDVTIVFRRGAQGAVIRQTTPNDGHYQWNIPTRYPHGTGFQIEVRSVSDPAIGDLSDGTFRLSNEAPGEASITVTAPNGGETFLTGGLLPVAWTSSGEAGSAVRIVLHRGGAAETIAASTANDGAFSWPIPAGQPLGSDYTVEVVSVSDPTVGDVSDAAFSITDSAPSASITLTTPNGGDILYQGTTTTIRWSSTGDVGGFVRITANRGAQSAVVVSSTPNDGVYEWSVPTHYPSGSGFFIEISSVSEPSVSDTSDATFTISNDAPPADSITVLSPNGGETIYRGSNTTITWAAIGETGPSVRIVLHRGENNAVVAQSTPNDGVFEWSVPVVFPKGDGFLIEVTSLSDPALTDRSDASFTLADGAPPSARLTLTAPNGGESYVAGGSLPISWSSTGDVGSQVRLVLHDGSNVTELAASTPNDGSFDWAIPASQALGANYTVEVISITDPAVRDSSDAPFTVTDSLPSAGITVLSPNGGETLARGGTWEITWTSEGVIGSHVKILFRKGAQSAVVVHQTPNDGAYTWSIPVNYPGGQGFQIEIQSVDDPSIHDMSDGTFFMD